MDVNIEVYKNGQRGCQNHCNTIWLQVRGPWKSDCLVWHSDFQNTFGLWCSADPVLEYLTRTACWWVLGRHYACIPLRAKDPVLQSSLRSEDIVHDHSDSDEGRTNCTALAQQMRFWQGVYYNPCPISLLSLSLSLYTYMSLSLYISEQCLSV